MQHVTTCKKKGFYLGLSQSSRWATSRTSRFTPRTCGACRHPLWPQIWGHQLGVAAGARGCLDSKTSGCGSKWKNDVGPQMWMSSLVLTIQLLGYLILTHTHLKQSLKSGICPGGCTPVLTKKTVQESLLVGVRYMHKANSWRWKLVEKLHQPTNRLNSPAIWTMEVFTCCCSPPMWYGHRIGWELVPEHLVFERTEAGKL